MQTKVQMHMLFLNQGISTHLWLLPVTIVSDVPVKTKNLTGLTAAAWKAQQQLIIIYNLMI